MLAHTHEKFRAFVSSCPFGGQQTRLPVIASDDDGEEFIINSDQCLSQIMNKKLIRLNFEPNVLEEGREVGIL